MFSASETLPMLEGAIQGRATRSGAYDQPGTAFAEQHVLGARECIQRR